MLPNYLRLPGRRRPQKRQLQGRSSPSFQELKQEESSGDCATAWSRASPLGALAERCSQGSTLGRGHLWRRHLRQNISKSCCLVRAEVADWNWQEAGQDRRSSYSAKAQEASPSPACGASGMSSHVLNTNPTTPSLQVHAAAHVCVVPEKLAQKLLEGLLYISRLAQFTSATISSLGSC